MTDQPNPISDRKAEHLALAEQSQYDAKGRHWGIHYEPLFSGLADLGCPRPMTFLGKTLNAPLWISSMTGGTGQAGPINKHLARACAEFGLGMGLGSCRPLLLSDEHLGDFDLRPILGPDRPFYANLGIAQVEELLAKKASHRLVKLVEMLRADGLIIHINPIQELLQPEGDRYLRPPLETIEEVLHLTSLPLIIKEVGQGFGPRSLEALLALPLQAVEFGALGGTHFGQLELLRRSDATLHPLAPLVRVGHTADEMVSEALKIKEKLSHRIRCQQLIVSGGVADFIEGYALVERLRSGGFSAVYGQAFGLLKHAQESYQSLQAHVKGQVEGLDMCARFLAGRS